MISISRIRAFTLVLVVFILSGCASTFSGNDQISRASEQIARIGKPAARSVKVMIITLFAPEADSWIKNLSLIDSIPVPGLSDRFPTVRCTVDDICLMTTDMGHTNAAASAMAMVLSDKLDLSRTYFLVTGIAGIDPNVGSIGSAAWARYLVDFGLSHEFDARERPLDWDTGYFGIHTKDPLSMPNLVYGTELFQLDEKLLQHALKLSRQGTLEDTEAAKAYRKTYSQATAQGTPTVLQCDTSTGDTYWHGNQLGERSTRWTKMLTEGKGTYCTTQQEDNATYESLRRGAKAGRLDLKRIAVLRTASNFDRPHSGQTAYESLNTKSGGFDAATANLYNAGWPVVKEIISNWSVWKDGTPDK